MADKYSTSTAPSTDTTGARGTDTSTESRRSSTQPTAWSRQTDQHRVDFEKQKSTLPLKCIAFALGLAAALLQICCVLTVAKRIDPFGLARMPIPTVLLTLVICLACTLQAQRLWKKAQQSDLHRHGNQAAVVMACAGFVPWVVFFLASKNLALKTKLAGVCAACAIIALSLIAVFVL